MSKELPKIVFDGQMLNNMLQGEIARRIMDQKKYVYNDDVSISIGESNFDTIGCKSVTDFLNKYSQELDKMGIKLFTIEQLSSGNDYKVTVDIGETNFTMTTENCANSLEFKEKNQAKLDQLPTDIALQILNEIDRKLDRTISNYEEEPDVSQSHQEELLQRLEELQKSKKTLNRRTIILERIKLGTLSLVGGKPVSTPSFSERKLALESQNKESSIEYKELLELEQYTIENTEKKIAQTSTELEQIEQEIAFVSAEIEKMKNNSNQETNKAENLPGSSSPTAMLPRKELEEDYYQRLENAANEGPIFHDNEMDFNLPEVDKKPHVIKKISKASTNLINKIKNFKFSEWIAPAFNFMKKYKIAVAITALTITSALSFLGGKYSALAKDQESSTIVNDVQENDVSESIVMGEKNISEITSTQPDILVENEQNEEKSFNDELQRTLNSILEGENKVYISSSNAINEENGLTPSERQLSNSWENAVPGAYYNMEDNKTHLLSETEANEYWQDGGSVAVRMDNNGTPIGFISVNQSEDAPAKGM